MSGLQTQKDLFITVNTKAGPDIFILHKLEGVEQVSELFELKAELYSMTAKNTRALTMQFEDILQKEASITMNLKGKKRYFNGILTNITQGPTVAFNDAQAHKQHEKTYFSITIRPKMWLLTLRENCRIFQKKTTLEIIKSVLAESQITLADETHIDRHV